MGGPQKGKAACPKAPPKHTNACVVGTNSSFHPTATSSGRRAGVSQRRRLLGLSSPARDGSKIAQELFLGSGRSRGASPVRDDRGVHAPTLRSESTVTIQRHTNCPISAGQPPSSLTGVALPLPFVCEQTGKTPVFIVDLLDNDVRVLGFFPEHADQ